MQVGIIEAGKPPAALVPRFGTYVTMTRRLLGDMHEYETFCATEGHMPRAGECEAFIVTGSARGAYDDVPWIAQLAGFLQSVRDSSKLIGICFGHQLMAQAFGGDVRKASQGWGLGLHRYEILEHAAWMDGANAIYATASHQDQVVRAPAGSTVLAASDFTPCAVLAYRNHPAISVQFHPEFEPAFSRALFAARRAPDLPSAEVRQAIDSLSKANDNARIGRWLNRFLAS